MIYLNKILPFFLLPTGVTIICLIAALLWRRWVLCGVGLAILWLASLPLVGSTAMRLAEGGSVRLMATEMPQADAVVVLSGMTTKPPGGNNVMEWGDAIDRFEGGVALFQGGKASRLVFTRGQVPWNANSRPEGELLADLAMARDVPQTDILLTAPAVNTQEEAQAVAVALAQQGMSNADILLVTSAYHMRRAVFLFQDAGLNVVPFPVDFQAGAGGQFALMSLLPSADSLAATELALREFYGYWFYRLVH